MFCFVFCPEACELLALQPGKDPIHGALEGKVLTSGLPGKSLKLTILIKNSTTS